MNRIKLNNRNKANLWLEQIDNSSFYKLCVDNGHKYCLFYMAKSGNYHYDDNNNLVWDNIQSIDPSGGPLLKVGDFVDDKGKYIIKSITNDNLFELSENNNN